MVGVPQLGREGQKFVSHLGQGDVGDVQTTLGNEVEQDVKGSREDVQLNREPAFGRIRSVVGRCGFSGSGIFDRVDQGAPPRAMSSRASVR